MGTHYRFAFGLLLFLAACSTSPSSGAAPNSGPPPAVAAADAAARLQNDVNWLADDARQGRRAGTQDARLAAKWLADRLSGLGLKPAGNQATFLQEFEVPLAARAGETSLVRLATDRGSRMVSDLKGVTPLFCSEGATAEGPLCFRGFGIESLDQQWNDFGDGDLKGAIVVMLRGVPGPSELLPAKAAEGAAVEHAANFDGSIFLKVMNAKRHGAVGVILLQEAGAAAPLTFDVSQAARAGIPALSATRALFEALLGEARARELCAAAEKRGHADFGPADPASIVRIVADVRRERGAALNVLAKLPGKDPTRTVVIGAHYDHLGLGGEGSLAADRTGEVHNGADDNASGTAAVLEMARLMAAGPAPAGDVIFALWSGEELGLLGSEYWCSHPTLELSNVRANLNLDMVGRARAPETKSAAPTLTILGAGTAAAFEPWLEPAAQLAGLTLHVNRSGQGVGGSDHMSFMKHKIPVLHFFTGLHADYHKPGDDSDKIDAGSMARIVGFGVGLVARMQAEAQLPWNEQEPQTKGEPERKPAPSNGGFKVWFGSIPDYAYEGKGVKLTGTSSGSPAEKAGMLAGDVLLGVGDVTIDTIHDFVYALSIYKPGDVVVTRFSRDGSEHSARITLATRAAQ